MARADELERDERIRHIHTDQIVTVDRVVEFATKVRVHFKSHGTRGWFECSPQREIAEV